MAVYTGCSRKKLHNHDIALHVRAMRFFSQMLTQNIYQPDKYFYQSVNCSLCYAFSCKQHNPKTNYYYYYFYIPSVDVPEGVKKIRYYYYYYYY